MTIAFVDAVVVAGAFAFVLLVWAAAFISRVVSTWHIRLFTAAFSVFLTLLLLAATEQRSF
jgi:uncharacterized membrane protein YozB (DUF420 family)